MRCRAKQAKDPLPKSHRIVVVAPVSPPAGALGREDKAATEREPSLPSP